jgi:hypothetical protein
MAALRALDRRVLEALFGRDGEPYAQLREQIPLLRQDGICKSAIGYRVVFGVDKHARPISNPETFLLAEVFGLSSESDEAIAFEVIVVNGFIWGLDATATASHYWPLDEDEVRLVTREEYDERLARR